MLYLRPSFQNEINKYDKIKLPTFSPQVEPNSKRWTSSHGPYTDAYAHVAIIIKMFHFIEATSIRVQMA
jgi:hypothetical protein